MPTSFPALHLPHSPATSKVICTQKNIDKLEIKDYQRSYSCAEVIFVIKEMRVRILNFFFQLTHVCCPCTSRVNEIPSSRKSLTGLQSP